MHRVGCHWVFAGFLLGLGACPNSGGEANETGTDGQGDDTDANPTASMGPSSGGAAASESSASPAGDTTEGSATPTTTNDSAADTGEGETGTAPCSDACPHSAGVEALCQQRFMFGLNYAWHYFGGDFGGIAAWEQPGVSANMDAIRSDLQAMKADAGANVIRWWMFADFRGDGVAFDDADVPTGLGGTTVADIEAALALAEEVDVYLMLTLFSFDTFRAELDGSPIPSLQPIVVDDASRAALMENVVRPVAQAVAQSPHADRMIAWDVINEPEWAIEGPSLYGGDEDFTPNEEEGLQFVSHGEMETFLADTIAVLRDESDALISVGAASFKWAHAWQNLDTDFHQFHMYDWIEEWWPHANPPSMYDLGDKPVVMGEFPLVGLSNADLPTMLDNWWGAGYAGALGWAYTDTNFSTAESLSQMKAFGDAHACEVAY